MHSNICIGVIVRNLKNQFVCCSKYVLLSNFKVTVVQTSSSWENMTSYLKVYQNFRPSFSIEFREVAVEFNNSKLVYFCALLLRLEYFNFTNAFYNKWSS
jgi:hypothetical protein